MMSSRRSFYVLLPLLATVVALLLAELALSLLYPVPFSLERNMYFEPDPYTGFRHRPDSVGSYLNGVEAKANSRGLRNAEVSIPKPQDVFRILVIGDSFTVGANVEQAEAYPQVLHSLLASGGNPRIEVVNAGVGGWGPFQYAQFLEYYGADYEPDLVITGLFVGNDIYIDGFRVEDLLTAVLGRRVSREIGQSPWGAVQVWFYERSNIARLLLKQSYESAQFARSHCGEFNNYFLAVQGQRMRNHIATPTAAEREMMQANVDQLGRMQQWAEQRGIPFLVVIFPDENQVNPQLQAALLDSEQARSAYDFGNPQQLLWPLLDDQGIAWADLTTAFAADGRCLFMNDSHWTPEGHAWVAALMQAELQRRDLLPR